MHVETDGDVRSHSNALTELVAAQTISGVANVALNLEVSSNDEAIRYRRSGFIGSNFIRYVLHAIR